MSDFGWKDAILLLVLIVISVYGDIRVATILFVVYLVVLMTGRKR